MTDSIVPRQASAPSDGGIGVGEVILGILGGVAAGGLIGYAISRLAKPKEVIVNRRIEPGAKLARLKADGTREAMTGPIDEVERYVY